MGDVAQQLSDGAAIGAQLVRHGVEIARQHRELVAAPLEPGAHAQLPAVARIQILGGQCARALLNAPDGRAQVLAPATSW